MDKLWLPKAASDENLLKTFNQARNRLMSWARPLGSGWEDYTPILTATTTNPTLGSDGAAEGRYKQTVDGTVHYAFRIQFGSSGEGGGASGGEGEYQVSLPVPMSSDSLTSANIALGSAVLFDWSVAGHKELAVVARASSTTIKLFVKDATVWHNNPFTWSDDDRFGGSLTYEGER